MSAIADWEAKEIAAQDAVDREELERIRKDGFENGRRLSGQREPLRKNNSDLLMMLESPFWNRATRERASAYVQGFVEGWEAEPRPWVAVDTWSR